MAANSCNTVQRFLRSGKLEDVQETYLKSLSRAYGGTQTAALTMFVASVTKALSTGKVRVAWVVCILHEQIPQKQCIALARSIDRNCGEANLLEIDCPKDPYFYAGRQKIAIITV